MPIGGYWGSQPLGAFNAMERPFHSMERPFNAMERPFNTMEHPWSNNCGGQWGRCPTQWSWPPNARWSATAATPSLAENSAWWDHPGAQGGGTLAELIGRDHGHIQPPSSLNVDTHVVEDRTSRTLFVGGLAMTASEEDLWNAFGRNGDVLKIRIAVDQATGRARGFAHVEFATIEQMQAAQAKFDGVEINGRPVRLEITRSGGKSAYLRSCDDPSLPRRSSSRSSPARPRCNRSCSVDVPNDKFEKAPSSASSSGSRSRSPRPHMRSRLWDSRVDGNDGVRPSLPPLAKPQKGGLKLFHGACVDIHDLVGGAQYNGCEGRILDGPNEKGRWEVAVQFQCEERKISLKQENVQPKPSCGWELVAMSLNTKTSSEDLSPVFAQCGLLKNVRMPRKEDGSSKCMCMIEMAQRSGAEAALKTLQGHVIHGKALKVEWSTRAKREMGLNDLLVGQLVCVLTSLPECQCNGIGKVVSVRDDGCDVVEVELDGKKQTMQARSDNLVILRDCPEIPHPAAQPTMSASVEERPVHTEEGAAEPPKRRRSAWGKENDGGVVYLRGATVVDPRPSLEPLPPEIELQEMATKDLRQLLISRGVDIVGCFEKADLLERARQPLEQHGQQLP